MQTVSSKGPAVPVIAIVKVYIHSSDCLRYQILLLEVDEFENVAPYIRGRLSREQVECIDTNDDLTHNDYIVC